jgi:acyl-CoA thioesterase FadM
VDVPRRLSHRYQVRFDEADAHGQLHPSGYLRFAQDMAWRHSELAGFGRDWYAQRSLAWLVRDVRLSITGTVTYADVVEVTTEVVGWRHVWARRHAELRRLAPPGSDEDGVPVASVDTDWVLLTEDGRPARVPHEISALFGTARTFERRRDELPPTPPDAARLTTRVRPIDVDPMGHMNNAAYLDVVEEGLALLPGADPGAAGGPDVASPARSYCIGYVRPALPGSELEVACWQPDPLSVACRISDGDACELARARVVRTPCEP